MSENISNRRLKVDALQRVGIGVPRVVPLSCHSSSQPLGAPLSSGTAAAQPSAAPGGWKTNEASECQRVLLKQVLHLKRCDSQARGGLPGNPEPTTPSSRTPCLRFDRASSWSSTRVCMFRFMWLRLCWALSSFASSGVARQNMTANASTVPSPGPRWRKT